MAFDVKCYDLAESFLKDRFKDVPQNAINELAQEIQNTIELFIEYDLTRLKQ